LLELRLEMPYLELSTFSLDSGVNFSAFSFYLNLGLTSFSLTEVSDSVDRARLEIRPFSKYYVWCSKPALEGLNGDIERGAWPPMVASLIS
jgi:hypothetical protein